MQRKLFCSHGIDDRSPKTREVSQIRRPLILFVQYMAAEKFSLHVARFFLAILHLAFCDKICVMFDILQKKSIKTSFLIQNHVHLRCFCI